jgi:uncharacterized protein (TIGR02466 family)
MSEMRHTLLFSSSLVTTTVEEKYLDKLSSVVEQYEWETYTDYDNRGSKGSIRKDVLHDHLDVGNALMSKFAEVNHRILKHECNFGISTSWFTKATKGTLCQSHCHKNSYWSGVLYFGDYDDNEDCGSIEFSSPIESLTDFYMVPKEWNVFNAEIWEIRPKRGALILFPSYLYHRIGQHNSDKDRYSLAFNIIPLGEYGLGDSTYNTNWFTQQSSSNQ